jgi:hypothetical protein
VPMVVCLNSRQAMGIVEPKQACPVHIVQCERVPDPMRSLGRRSRLRYAEANAPPIGQPIATAVVIERAGDTQN